LSTVRINNAVEKYYDEFDAWQRSDMRLLGACTRVYEVTKIKKIGGPENK